MLNKTDSSLKYIETVVGRLIFVFKIDEEDTKI